MDWETFKRELECLQDEVLAMGQMVEDAITRSVENLSRQDLEETRQLLTQNYTLNQKCFDIEANCLSAIVLRQPMNSDVRTLAAILYIATELERIGDYARDIARVSLTLDSALASRLPDDLHRMAEHARGMLHQALDAFARRDVPLALTIPAQDEVVDGLCDLVYRELLTYAMAEPKNIRQVNQLLRAAHNLECTADQVTHICERVVFTVTGNMAEINRSLAVL